MFYLRMVIGLSEWYQQTREKGRLRLSLCKLYPTEDTLPYSLRSGSFPSTPKRKSYPGSHELDDTVDWAQDECCSCHSGSDIMGSVDG